MHEAVVRMCNGDTWCGGIWTWRPKEGWLSLSGDPRDAGPEKIFLREIDSAVNRGQRVSVDKVEDVDLLSKARAEGWDGT